MKSVKIVLSVVALTMFAGCSTLADSRAGKGTGLTREYTASVDKVWSVVPSSLEELKLPMVGENRQEGYILAQRGISFASYGENVAIFIESIVGSNKTKVEVVSKKAMATNIFAPDWAKDVLDKISDKLKD